MVRVGKELTEYQHVWCITRVARMVEVPQVFDINGHPARHVSDGRGGVANTWVAC